MRRFLALTVLAAGLGLTAATPASAEERTCRGSIGAVTVDNLRVPQGASCTLNGTRVQGTASTATSSARRTGRRPPAAATSCRATRKTSALASDHRLTSPPGPQWPVTAAPVTGHCRATGTLLGGGGALNVL